MNFSEYQRAAIRTAGGINIEVCGLGMAGEVGECIELIKKHVWHGHELNPLSMQKEIGDVLWYLATTSHLLGLELADAARANIVKLRQRDPQGSNQEASRDRGKEKVVYISHPLAGDLEENIRKAEEWIAWAADFCLPLAPWVSIAKHWNEEQDRARGLLLDKRAIELCDAIFLCGDRLSPGMREELEYAKSLGLQVFDFLNTTKEKARDRITKAEKG